MCKSTDMYTNKHISPLSAVLSHNYSTTIYLNRLKNGTSR